MTYVGSFFFPQPQIYFIEKKKQKNNNNKTKLSYKTLGGRICVKCWVPGHSSETKEIVLSQVESNTYHPLAATFPKY